MTQKQRKIFYTIIFFLGVILIIWEINIFRETIIDLNIPIGIIIIVGITTFIIDFKNYKKTYNYSKIRLYIFSSMHYIIGFGFIACSIFMLLNYYFTDQNIRTESFKIVKTSSLPSGSKFRINVNTPTFEINYNGEIKELVFSSDYYEKRKFYKVVELQIEKGLFGFEVIKNKKLSLKLLSN